MKVNNSGLCDSSVEELVASFEASPELRACLDDLEARIDPETEEALLADYRIFLDGGWPEPLFAPQRPRAVPSGMDWPEIPVNKALVDFNAMALQQFGGCSSALAGRSGAPMTVRSNYGVCISSAWFGCELHMMEDKFNTLPTSLPVCGGSERIDALIDASIPDVTAGYGARVYAMGRIFKELRTPYPKISRYVHVYHPDFQSPIDTCELVWGNEVFTEFYENPERVHRFLDLLAKTYIDGIRKWETVHPFAPDINAHWGLLHKGSIMLRTDSGMNLSPEMYDEFIRPYEQRCLDACGGGAIHFCGRGDHFIASMTSQRGLTGIQMSQPELNDMEIIYRHTVDRGTPLLGFGRPTAEKALAAGRNLNGLVLTGPKQ